MNALLFAFLLHSLVEPKPPTAVIEQSAPTASKDARCIVVVADGSRSWSGDESDAIIDQLRSEIDASLSLHVARFDAETSPGTELVLAGSNRDLVLVRPGTPMNEVIALTLDGLAVRQPVAAMVVIAHSQISPTYVRTDQTIGLLDRSAVPVYTIHLAGRAKPPSVFRRAGRALTAGALWAVQALIEEDRQTYSAEGTGRMLRSMSEKTGGLSCRAPDREAAHDCAQTIAARIGESISSGLVDRSRADSGSTP